MAFLASVATAGHVLCEGANYATMEMKRMLCKINSFSVPIDLPQYPENCPDLGHIDQQELRVAQQDDLAIGPAMETEWKKTKGC